VAVLDDKYTDSESRVLRSLCSIVLALLVVGLAGCTRATSCGTDASGLPKCSVSADFVHSQPEATLSYSGSTVYSQNVHSEQHLIGSTNPAGAHSIFATSAPMTSVYTWYQNWLTGHGWHVSAADALLPLEVSAQGYARGNRESFVVGADSQQNARMLGYPIPLKLQSETLYEINFLIEPYSGK